MEYRITSSRNAFEDGVIVGAKKDPEANMWLNPQSWSVISGFASKEQGEKAMESVHEILNTVGGYSGSNSQSVGIGTHTQDTLDAAYRRF